MKIIGINGEGKPYLLVNSAEMANRIESSLGSLDLELILRAGANVGDKPRVIATIEDRDSQDFPTIVIRPYRCLFESMTYNGERNHLKDGSSRTITDRGVVYHISNNPIFSKRLNDDWQ